MGFWSNSLGSKFKEEGGDEERGDFPHPITEHHSCVNSRDLELLRLLENLY